MTQKIDMLHGSIWDKLILFALPLAVTSIFEQFFNAADVAILGRAVSKNAMAAVGSTNSAVSLLVTWFIGLSLGANVVVAGHLGAGREERAGQAVHTALLLSFGIGILMTVLGEFFMVQFLESLSVPAEVLPISEQYLRTYLIGLPFISLYNFEAAVFRSRGDTRTPLLSLMTASLLNVGFNLIAVHVLHLGIIGVAGATVLAGIINAAVLLLVLSRSRDCLRFRIRRLRISRRELRDILQIGTPAALQGSVFCISNVVIQSAINSLGADVMAASAAAFTIEINLYCFINAFGQAATTFISQNFNARNLRRCRDIVKVSMLLDCLVTIVLTAVIFWKAADLLQFFNADPSVVSLGTTRIYYVLAAQIFDTVIEVLSGVMRGYGQSLPPALTAMVGICGVRLGWIYTVFPRWHTFAGLLVAYPASWVVTAAGLCVLYGRFSRKFAERLPEA